MNVVVFFNFYCQIIIDECAMCTEPETLIPLVGFSPAIKRIILIGDHKQLQPISRCKEAKKALLNKSLFERYTEIDADHSKVIMLTEQYRMVTSLLFFLDYKLVLLLRSVMIA